MRALVVVALLAGVAHADDVDPAHNKLGMQIEFGWLPLADQRIGAIGLGLGVDHPVFGATRMFAEYEWLFVSDIPDDGTMPTTNGTGHRVHLGVRRMVASKRVESVRFHADVEGGGGLGMYDHAAGVEVVPHGFVGLRAGYTVYSPSSRAAHTFDVAVCFRATAVERGVGFGGGIAIAWGD